METIDDIVREMRERSEAMEIHGTPHGIKVAMKEFAKRIEAAVKNQFRDTTKTMPHLREVTKKEEVVVAKMETTTPRRNCDVYTMAEQSKRHEEYCKSHTTNGRCVKCPLWQMRLLGINCAVAWANFPYEKEGVK